MITSIYAHFLIKTHRFCCKTFLHLALVGGSTVESPCDSPGSRLAGEEFSQAAREMQRLFSEAAVTESAILVVFYR